MKDDKARAALSRLVVQVAWMRLDAEGFISSAIQVRHRLLPIGRHGMCRLEGANYAGRVFRSARVPTVVLWREGPILRVGCSDLRLHMPQTPQKKLARRQPKQQRAQETVGVVLEA